MQAKRESQVEFPGRLWSEWDVKIVAGTGTLLFHLDSVH